ncbi:hypothetical protein [Jannaschia sp. R86511]|uniref:hypothetical protein n=1 Tax=Jannaschia sp. R86511 TaxID=3093853 RepID=UPI0036D35687
MRADLRPPWGLDGMTLLGSRPALDAWVAGHRDRPGTAVFLNPASMLRFNMDFSPVAGDLLLIRLATALQTAAPPDVEVYRVSGGQFMAVRLGDDRNSARELADLLKGAALSIPVPPGWSFHVACGVATGAINQRLLEAAEQAM